MHAEFCIINITYCKWFPVCFLHLDILCIAAVVRILFSCVQRNFQAWLSSPCTLGSPLTNANWVQDKMLPFWFSSGFYSHLALRLHWCMLVSDNPKNRQWTVRISAVCCVRSKYFIQLKYFQLWLCYCLYKMLNYYLCSIFLNKCYWLIIGLVQWSVNMTYYFK